MTCLVLLLTMFTTQDAWIKLNSPEGRFSIQCPGSMKEHIITSQPEVGEVKYHTFSYQRLDTTGQATVFMVSYYDYPLGEAFDDSLNLKEDLYAATIEEATQSIGGKLVYAQDDFSYSNFGKIWRINFRDGEAFVKTKAFFYRNRFYSIQIVASIGSITALEENKFFNSFKLVGV